MKNRILYTTFLTLLSLSILSGCEKAAAPTETSSTKETTTATTEEIIYDDPITGTEYATYEEFAAGVAEKFPAASLYTPPDSVAANWNCLQMATDVSFYRYSFYDNDSKRSILLEFQPNETYQDIQEHIDERSQYTSSITVEIVLQEVNYIVEYYPDYDEYTLYGLRNGTNEFYTIMVWNDDGSLVTPDDLLALRDALEL